MILFKSRAVVFLFSFAQVMAGYDEDIARAHQLANMNRAQRLSSYHFESYKPPNATAGPPETDWTTAIAILFLNQNQTAMTYADTVLNAIITFYYNNNGAHSFGSHYQNMLVRAFALFNSRSRWVKQGEVGSLSPGTEAAFQRYFFAFLTACADSYPNETSWGFDVRRDSEVMRHITHLSIITTHERH